MPLSPSIRLVLMGTGPFGPPTFERLYASGADIVGVVTRPLPPAHGRRTPPPSPVRELAVAKGTPILDPDDVNSEAARADLSALQADLLVVCDYGRILSAETLATARLGGANLHSSLLPKYRGAAPINWAIFHGEIETGVSVIHMTPRMDAGPVIAQARCPIQAEETAGELELRLSQLGAELVTGAIEDLFAGRASAMAQDPALASKAPRLKKADGQLDWARPALAVKNHVRAMQPWPRAFTFWLRAGAEALRLVLGPLSVIESPDAAAAPGTVLEAAGQRLVVATAAGACLLSEVQPAGKRMLSAEEFLRGYPIQVGDALGAEPRDEA